MNDLVGILLIFAGIVLFLLFLFYFIEADYHKLCTRLSFKIFLDFYYVNPSRWKLHDDYATYIIEDDDYLWRRVEKNVFFNSIKSYYQYKHWLFNKDKRERELFRDKNAAEIAKYVQEDAAALRKKSLEEQQTAADELLEILKRLNGNAN